MEPKVTLSVGKFSVEKVEDLGARWAKLVDLRHPGIDFVASVGLLVNDKRSLEKDGRSRRWSYGDSGKSQRAWVMVQTLTLTLNSRWLMMSQ